MSVTMATEKGRNVTLFPEIRTGRDAAHPRSG
jgi:hypothetical protein